jgi:hypothetical protein
MSDPNLYSQYLGLACLLGRLINTGMLSSDDRSCVDRAFVDVNAVLRRSGSKLTFQKTSGGGYAPFDN